MSVDVHALGRSGILPSRVAVPSSFQINAKESFAIKGFVSHIYTRISGALSASRRQELFCYSTREWRNHAKYSMNTDIALLPLYSRRGCHLYLITSTGVWNGCGSFYGPICRGNRLGVPVPLCTCHTGPQCVSRDKGRLKVSPEAVGFWHVRRDCSIDSARCDWVSFSFAPCEGRQASCNLLAGARGDVTTKDRRKEVEGSAVTPEDYGSVAGTPTSFSGTEGPVRRHR